METVTEDLIEGIVRQLVAASDPRQIVLFGSRARQDAGPDSDLDLMVVVDEPLGGARSRREETVRLRRCLRGHLVPIDILVFSRDEVERWRSAINHVVHYALAEGRTVYERP
jgi:predicted nucleotidyltransferase